jgi:hypothetical protein
LDLAPVLLDLGRGRRGVHSAELNTVCRSPRLITANSERTFDMGIISARSIWDQGTRFARRIVATVTPRLVT